MPLSVRSAALPHPAFAVATGITSPRRRRAGPRGRRGGEPADVRGQAAVRTAPAPRRAGPERGPRGGGEPATWVSTVNLGRRLFPARILSASSGAAGAAAYTPRPSGTSTEHSERRIV